MNQEPLPERKWVCASCTVPLKGGGTGIKFFEITDTGELGRERIYARKAFRGVRRAGMIYSIQATDEQCLPGTIRFVNAWTDRDAMDAWQATDAARIADRERKRGLTKATAIPGLANKLEPLRKIYMRLDWYHKAGFRDVIDRYLATGKL